MLEIIHVPINRQIQRIILAIFDGHKDGKISKQEFNDRLGKYTKKAPITTEDIAGDIINEQDKKDLVEMWNKENREKEVYEDYDFDVTDADELLAREHETMRLIKEGRLPNEPIGGTLDIKIEKIDGMLKIPNKNCCFFKLRRTYFDEKG